MVEERDCTADQRAIHEVNAGVYVFDAAFLRRGLAALTPSNAQGELYLTDLVAMAAREGEVASVRAAFEDTRGVNDRADLAACARVLRHPLNAGHMEAGVTLLDPETHLHRGRGHHRRGHGDRARRLAPRTQTRVGQGVTVGQGAVLIDSEVGDGTTVLPYSVMNEARVGPRCLIGPFARLRPGSELGEAVELGNFAETKKVQIGNGTKAHHHCYLGDGTIGAKVNVGAGTITCNYDGFQKHRTEIGDGAFIGSDSQLVAPVKVGEGAYVGAGNDRHRGCPVRHPGLLPGPPHQQARLAEPAASRQGPVLAHGQGKDESTPDRAQGRSRRPGSPRRRARQRCRGRGRSSTATPCPAAPSCRTRCRSCRTRRSPRSR